VNEKLDEKSNKVDDKSEVIAVITIFTCIIFWCIFILLFIFILLSIYNIISTLPQFHFIEFILILIISLAISLGLIYYSSKKENHDD
jgi:uncharacterized membrane protein